MIEKYGLINRLMRYEDQLYSHPGYYNGALAAIDIYTRIHDHPELTEEKLRKPRKQLQQLLTARKKTHQLRMMIPTEQSC